MISEKLYNKGIDWIFRFGPRIVVAAVVLIVGEWLISVIKRRVKNHIHRNDYSPTLRPFFQSLIFIALQVLLILLVMQIVGIQPTIFAAVLAAFGAAAGLALSGTLQNFASGVLILMLKPFVQGDNIVAQGEEGTVSDIQLFYTIVNTFDNRTVVLPNSKLSNEVIINITREGKRRLDIELKFGYAVDMEQVKKVIIDAIQTSDDVLKDPAPRVGISSLEADGFKLAINAWVNAHGFHDTQLIINERLLNALRISATKLPGMESKS